MKLSSLWFAVKDGKYDLTDEECAEFLALLQEEVTVACKCQNVVLYPEDEPELSCDEDKCQKLVDSITEYIEKMKVVEEKLQNMKSTSINHLPRKRCDVSC